MERGGLTKQDFKLRVLIWLRSICECRLPKDSVQLTLVFIGNSWTDLLQIASLNLCMANALFTMPHGQESLALYENQYETAMGKRVRKKRKKWKTSICGRVVLTIYQS